MSTSPPGSSHSKDVRPCRIVSGIMPCLPSVSQAPMSGARASTARLSGKPELPCLAMEGVWEHRSADGGGVEAPRHTGGMTATTAPGSLWRHRSFGLLWAGDTVSQVGSQLTGLALPVLAVTV